MLMPKETFGHIDFVETSIWVLAEADTVEDVCRRHVSTCGYDTLIGCRGADVVLHLLLAT